VFNILQFLLELVLLISAVFVLHRQGWPAVHRRTLWIVTLGAVATNTAVFAFGYATLLKLSGLSPGLLWAMAFLQLVKWSVVAYVITRLALTLLPGMPVDGFALLHRTRSLPQILLTGFAVAVVAVAVVTLKFSIEQKLGFHGANLWAAFQEKAAAMRPMIFWAGLRNLVGEEIMPQLGIQTLIMYYAGPRRWVGAASILGAAWFFEVWHDGFQYLYFNNFLFGAFFACAYRKYGYETAAVAHCFTDWLLYLGLPLFLK
jgi:hypothetical protein